MCLQNPDKKIPRQIIMQENPNWKPRPWLDTALMGLIDLIGQGLSSPDPLVREAYLMVYDYINYVTAKPGTPLGPAPS